MWVATSLKNTDDKIIADTQGSKYPTEFIKSMRSVDYE